MDLLTFLLQSPDLSDRASGERFASEWSIKRIEKGTHIIRQEEPETNEFILLEGCFASRIYDPGGLEVCVGLYVGPNVLTPNIARTRDSLSIVEVEAVTDATIARMDRDKLLSLMLASEPVRDWANGVLRKELSHKADREWCLAALGGSDRLAWFRERFPGYEEIFGHSLIASFLGMTPVTLSRLRSQERRR
ncbi:MAG: Crp/Fnr family transcriptional regulator [Sulfitobacter sp.]